ncbi:MAG TPA: hypothetical protein VJA46_06120 [Acidimicrobiia bacterium]|nr:hypothetical protein [Acidimicrobiia bacterium]
MDIGVELRVIDVTEEEALRPELLELKRPEAIAQDMHIPHMSATPQVDHAELNHQTRQQPRTASADIFKP